MERQQLVFKIATEPEEFELIYRLNYRTFVEEIPQHHANPEQRLIDRFDAENTYLTCLCAGELYGMVAVRDRRPFSLDQKLADLDHYLPASRSICEIRLLAVEPKHRNGRVFNGLMSLLVKHFRQQGHDLAIISGTVRQLKLYQHLGFIPFGPLVGSDEALYQPMYLTIESFRAALPAFPWSPPRTQPAVNLLPGPVAISSPVRQAFTGEPVSHRAPDFVRDFQETRSRLRTLTGAHTVQVLAGSGTLANDVVACQLAQRGEPGVVLSNGEFGDRLCDQAKRFGLDFVRLEQPWGVPFDSAALIQLLDGTPHLRWLWAVHCETSSGILNDIEQLGTLCSARDISLCLDCISSLGTVPVNLSQVTFASGVSGKGLGAFPGLAIVFANQLPSTSMSIPRYLDLNLYEACNGIPFTHPSNLHHALLAALRQLGDGGSRFQQLNHLSAQLRLDLQSQGFALVGTGPLSPAVITIQLPESVSSEVIGAHMADDGFLLSYQSGYLLRRNWIQICLMGECRTEELAALPSRLAAACGKRYAPPMRLDRPAAVGGDC